MEEVKVLDLTNQVCPSVALITLKVTELSFVYNKRKSRFVTNPDCVVIDTTTPHTSIAPQRGSRRLLPEIATVCTYATAPRTRARAPSAMGAEWMNRFGRYAAR